MAYQLHWVSMCGIDPGLFASLPFFVSEFPSFHFFRNFFSRCSPSIHHRSNSSGLLNPSPFQLHGFFPVRGKFVNPECQERRFLWMAKLWITEDDLLSHLRFCTSPPPTFQRRKCFSLVGQPPTFITGHWTSIFGPSSLCSLLLESAPYLGPISTPLHYFP